jgi:hypothetical protein
MQVLHTDTDTLMPGPDGEVEPAPDPAQLLQESAARVRQRFDMLVRRFRRIYPTWSDMRVARAAMDLTQQLFEPNQGAPRGTLAERRRAGDPTARTKRSAPRR